MSEICVEIHGLDHILIPLLSLLMVDDPPFVKVDHEELVMDRNDLHDPWPNGGL